MRKKIVTVLLAVVCAFSFCACAKGNTGNAPVSGGLNDVVLWGMPGTEKVYKDIARDSDYYKNYKTDAKIDLLMAKGEYEGGQIIISANKDAKFDATASALTNGANTIAAENVEIFAQKYITVSTNHDRASNLPTAKYPDALVPMANLKAAGENIVKKDENQGLYVRVKTATNQAAGVYTGNITVKIGDDSKEIPVRVEVADVAVSEVVHNKSVFLNAWYFFEGELDTTQEMLDKYNEALLEYRLGMGTSLTWGRHHNEDLSTEEKMNAWIKKAYDYMQDPACSTIKMPYEDNENFVKGLLTAIADYSAEKNYNMFDKLVIYAGGLIDEPRGNGKIDYAIEVCNRFKTWKEAVAATISDTAVRASLMKIPMLCTEYYHEGLAAAGVTFCPTFDHFDTESQRAQYSNQEGWWYGCITPRAPFPTYHIDDTWLSARLIGWMQAQYNITGNLYWATDVYASSSKNGYQSLEEYYEGSAVRYPAVNGDGFLFYSGKKYGIDGPIGSMRLEAIRDGYEEYEILYAIKENYATADSALTDSPDFEGFVRSLTKDMYTGTTVSVKTETFTEARRALFDAAMRNEKTGFAVMEDRDDGYGERTYSFTVKSDWSVREGETTLTPTKTEGGYSVYTCTKQLTETENTMRFTFTKNNDTVQFVYNLGGKATVTAATELTAADFTNGTVTPTVTLTTDGQKISLGAVNDVDKTEQSFALVGKAVSGVQTDTKYMILHIAYEGTDMPTLTLNGKFAGSRIATTLANCKLNSGDNTITIDLGQRDLSELGALEKLKFAFYRASNESSIAAHELTLKSIVIYAK